MDYSFGQIIHHQGSYAAALEDEVLNFVSYGCQTGCKSAFFFILKSLSPAQSYANAWAKLAAKTYWKQ